MDRRKQLEDTDGEAPEDTTPNGALPNRSWTAPRGGADDDQQDGEFAGEFEAHADADGAESTEPFDAPEPEPAPLRSGPPGSNGISRSMPPAHIASLACGHWSSSRWSPRF